jgi:Protein of unknown function (DUF3800)
MIHVFIDESGSPVLSDQSYYVITAVICTDSNYDNCIAGLNDIKTKNKIGDELKSSKIGSDAARRVKILKEIASLKFSTVTIAINKSTLNKDSGLRFKTSMYKYCQRKLFNHIYKYLDSVTVVCDSYGSSEFMKSFEKYLDRNFQARVFSDKEFKYSTPIIEQMLQVSDFIGGSIRRSLQGDDDGTSIDVIKEKLLHLEVWPISESKNKSQSLSDGIDQAIAGHAFKFALEFIENEKDNVLKECYSYLTFDRYGDGEFVFGDEILRHLKENHLVDQERDRDWLMQEVIAPLRDKGALIVSSRDGYKIPESRDDVKRFAEFVQGKTDPYLDRYQKIRKNLFLGTGMQYDLLDDSPLLKKYIKSVNEIG